MLRTILTLLICSFLSSFPAHSQNEKPIKATVCDLHDHPQKFNHQVVEVTAYVSHGFEDSNVFDPACNDSRYGSIWFEYGVGSKAEGTYCCDGGSNRSNSKSRMTNGVSVPLTEDYKFKRLDAYFKSIFKNKYPAYIGSRLAYVTMIGRFFAKPKDGGYGHGGSSSLFVLQRVLAFDDRTYPQLDNGDIPKALHIEVKPPVSYQTFDESPMWSAIELQHRADKGGQTYLFDDPSRIAKEFLVSHVKALQLQQVKLKLLQQEPGRLLYEAYLTNPKRRVRLLLSRPEWLARYATSPERVIWIVRDGEMVPEERGRH